MTDNVPELTVTMLGPTTSGKTTFLLGMYASMSIGVADYFLHARDNDLDLTLAKHWRELLLQHTLPPPTMRKPVHYPFLLKSGMEPALAIDWVDYRGAAMAEEAATEEDAAVIQARLQASDAVYLVIDAKELRKGVSDDNIFIVDAETYANRMRTLVHNAFADRSWPAMVVVVTKADILGADSPGKSDDEIADDVVAAVRRLLPICFLPGVRTMVCPVSLGDFGADPASREAKPGSVRPVNMHKPLLFTLARTLEARVDETAVQIDGVRDDLAGSRADIDRLDRSFFGGLRFNKRADLKGRRDAVAKRESLLKSLHLRDRERIRRISAELRNTRIFIDGDEAEWSLD